MDNIIYWQFANKQRKHENRFKNISLIIKYIKPLLYYLYIRRNGIPTDFIYVAIILLRCERYFNEIERSLCFFRL